MPPCSGQMAIIQYLNSGFGGVLAIVSDVGKGDLSSYWSLVYAQFS